MRIKLKNITIGNRRIQIPVWEKESNVPGKNIVVTGGMDGDEYAGIEAAYELINYYTNKNFNGRLAIIPLVNVPGFESGVSFNPIDSKYPKHFYPGKKEGTATEQLIFYISENYISKADIWIDLHGGALVEKLIPFVWVWETGNSEVDILARKILSLVKSEIKVFDKTRWRKIQETAKHNVVHVTLESGELGQRKQQDIRRLVAWTKNIVKGINLAKTTNKKTSVYTRVNYLFAPKDGFWYPIIKIGEIKKGQVVGKLISFSGKKLSEIKSYVPGKVLWYRTSLNAKKGEILAAVTA